jgi:hypothetical protein
MSQENRQGLIDRTPSVSASARETLRVRLLSMAQHAHAATIRRAAGERGKPAPLVQIRERQTRAKEKMLTDAKDVDQTSEFVRLTVALGDPQQMAEVFSLPSAWG